MIFFSGRLSENGSNTHPPNAPPFCGEKDSKNFRAFGATPSPPRATKRGRLLLHTSFSSRRFNAAVLVWILCIAYCNHDIFGTIGVLHAYTHRAKHGIFNKYTVRRAAGAKILKNTFPNMLFLLENCDVCRVGGAKIKIDVFSLARVYP